MVCVTSTSISQVFARNFTLTTILIDLLKELTKDR